MYRILNNRNKAHITKKTDLTRRGNKDPLGQGQLKEIARLFIWPFLQYKPSGQAIEIFFEQLFRTDTCRIERWVVTGPFIMPGHVLDTPGNHWRGHGGVIKMRRQASVGQHVWIRTDSMMPDRIDVELVYKNQQSMTFLLNQAQYTNILSKVELYPYKCHVEAQK